MRPPRRDGKRKPFKFGKDKKGSADTIAAIQAMAKSGALRDAGPKPTDEERQQLHYDIQDVKSEAQYGFSGRSGSGERLDRGTALRGAAKKLDKTIEKQKTDPTYNSGVRSATEWVKK
jgi:hypothetical protein